MSTDMRRYQQELLVALRRLGMPGPAVGEALAEIEAHVAETGEDPSTAFGAPRAYAAELVDTLHAGRDANGAGLLRSLTWTHGVIAVASSAGAWLLLQGILEIRDGGQVLWRLPPVAATVVGFALLAVVGRWFVLSTRGNAERVPDPRTGKDVAPPLPWWVFACLAAGPCAVLSLAAVVVTVSR